MLADVEGGSGGGTQVSFRSDGLRKSFEKIVEKVICKEVGVNFYYFILRRLSARKTERIFLQDLLKIVTVLGTVQK